MPLFGDQDDDVANLCGGYVEANVACQPALAAYAGAETQACTVKVAASPIGCSPSLAALLTCMRHTPCERLEQDCYAQSMAVLGACPDLLASK